MILGYPAAKWVGLDALNALISCPGNIQQVFLQFKARNYFQLITFSNGYTNLRILSTERKNIIFWKHDHCALKD